MIYERKNISQINVCPDDLANKAVKINITAFPLGPSQNSKTQSSSLTGKVSERQLRRFKRARRTRATLSKILLSAALVLFCTFLADTSFFDGSFYTFIRNKTGKIYMQTTRLPSDFTAIPDRTLYTITYSNPVSQTVTQKTDNFSATTEDTQNDAEKTASVSAGISGSSLDGVMYYPITTLDLSNNNIYTLTNETSYNINIEDLSNKTPAAFKNLSVSDDPLVLILHTHACESYSEYTSAYPENAETRSEDISKNVVRVGEEIADTLAGFGITSIHCSTLHDKDSFINAYTESAASVKKYLEMYPSIKFVIDVHRDAIIKDNGESIKPLASIAGEDYAQLMFVVGTNELGHNHPDWKNNLSLAVKLQENISEAYPNLCRNINLRNVPFNQQLSDGYLLLEVGTCANTLSEALRSARAFGQEFARLICSV